MFDFCKEACELVVLYDKEGTAKSETKKFENKKILTLILLLQILPLNSIRRGLFFFEAQFCIALRFL